MATTPAPAAAAAAAAPSVTATSNTVVSSSQLDAYDVLNPLGRGTYGRVNRVRRKSDGKVLCIKQVPLDGMTEAEQQETLNEALVHKTLDHPNIIKLHESFIERGELCLVMDLAEGGDLGSRIKKMRDGQRFTELELWNFLIQIAEGLQHIHERRVLHRDLKPQNVFLDSADNIKIGDLGLGRILGPNSYARSFVGTPLYQAPEIVQEIPYSFKSDVWAMGCLLYELAALRAPFIATNTVALGNKIVHQAPDPLPEIYSSELRFIIMKMLEKDERSRPDIAQVLRHSPVQIRVERRHHLLREQKMVRELRALAADRDHLARQVEHMRHQLQKAVQMCAHLDIAVQQRDAVIVSLRAQLRRARASPHQPQLLALATSGADDSHNPAQEASSPVVVLAPEPRVPTAAAAAAAAAAVAPVPSASRGTPPLVSAATLVMQLPPAPHSAPATASSSRVVTPEAIPLTDDSSPLALQSAPALVLQPASPIVAPAAPSKGRFSGLGAALTAPAPAPSAPPAPAAACPAAAAGAATAAGDGAGGEPAAPGPIAPSRAASASATESVSETDPRESINFSATPEGSPERSEREPDRLPTNSEPTPASHGDATFTPGSVSPDFTLQQLRPVELAAPSNSATVPEDTPVARRPLPALRAVLAAASAASPVPVVDSRMHLRSPSPSRRQRRPSDACRPSSEGARAQAAALMGLSRDMSAQAHLHVHVLYHWRRSVGDSPPSRLVGATKTSKTWEGRQGVCLPSTKRSLLMVFSCNLTFSARSTPTVKTLRVRAEGEETFTRLKHYDVNELLSAGGSRRYALHVSMKRNQVQGKIHEVMIEFDAPNAIDELFVLRADKNLLRVVLPEALESAGGVAAAAGGAAAGGAVAAGAPTAAAPTPGTSPAAPAVVAPTPGGSAFRTPRTPMRERVPMAPVASAPHRAITPEPQCAPSRLGLHTGKENEHTLPPAAGSAGVPTWLLNP